MENKDVLFLYLYNANEEEFINLISKTKLYFDIEYYKKNSSERKIVFDFKNCQYTSSHIVNLIFSIKKNIKIEILNINEHIKKLFLMLNLGELINE